MPSQPPSASVSSRPLGWLGVVGIMAATLGVPALLNHGEPPRQPFNEQPLRALEKARPEGVLVGDSMLGTRIDPQVLKSVAGEKWEVLAQPGSSSAMWYLMLKNLIAVQSPPPRMVIFFFRDRQLTHPTHRTEGSYRKTIESYMRGPEPLLEEVLQTNARLHQPPRLNRFSSWAYPVQRRREEWQRRVQSWALDAVAGSREYAGIRTAAQEIFSAKNLRADQQQDEAEEGGRTGLDADDHDFTAAVDLSFLPRMLEIARAKDIRLVFFRVKRRPDAPGVPIENLTGPAYHAALRAYLERAGATLIDETRDADVTIDFYGSGDHVKPEMEKRYTEMFWRKVGPLIPAPVR